MVRQRLSPRKLLFILLALTALIAVLLYASHPVGESGVWPPQLIETDGPPRSIMLQGQWLIWTVYRPSETRSVPDFFVYDLDSGHALELPHNQGHAAWLNGDDLHILRLQEEPTTETPRPNKNLYVLNLQTGEETLLEESFNRRAWITHRHVAWGTLEPEICHNAQDCSEILGYGCGIGIRLRDWTTGEQELWGILSRHEVIVDITPSLLILSGRMGACDIKSHSGPIQVIDLDSKEYRVIGPGGVSPNLGAGVVGAVNRTVAYVIWPDHTRVLHIEPRQSAEVLLDVKDVQGLGLAGPDILLYAKEVSGHPDGLFAFNMRTEEYLEFVAEGYIKDATGDSQHVAWVTGDDQLYVASLNLESLGGQLAFESPLPTFSPGFLVPRPFPSPPVPSITPTPAH